MTTLMREHVEACGFTLDPTTGYRWMIDAPDSTPGSRTQLVLMPDDEGWIAEIHNLLDTDDGTHRVALPRLLTTEDDVRALLRLCGVTEGAVDHGG